MSSQSWQEGDLLWAPSEARREAAQLTAYTRNLERRLGLRFEDYRALWAWSVTETEVFWQSLWDYFELMGDRPPEGAVLSSHGMPGASFFPGTRLNYAEHALRGALGDERLAVIARDEQGFETLYSRDALASRVARAAEGLRRLGVVQGDRVVAFLPNGPEALIAFLASASLGAIWSSCSPEFGVPAVLDRFSQIAPKVLITVDGYRHGGKVFDRRAAVAQIQQGLPTLAHTVWVDRLEPETDAGDEGEVEAAPGELSWETFLAEDAPLRFTRVPFDHPLWILYSSGTTGLPKAIVQGHGGILLEHFKALSLHCDLGPGDRFFWYTTTGWMMWNFLIGGLLVGATVVLYEGSPAYPDLGALWRMADETQMTYFGTSAPFLLASRKAGVVPAQLADLSRLRGLGSTGAPLPAEGFGWVYEAIHPDLLLGSVSGGTDVCTAFVLSCPWEEVRAAEIQCRGLGCKVEAFNPAGESVLDEVGELVITEPMPSMPVFFWNDPDGKRLREAYFSDFGSSTSRIWRHGDWMRVTERGSCVISGRSDSTLNRGGVRMGSSEFYRVLDRLPQVVDAVVVDTGTLAQEGALWLFVVLQPGLGLDEAMRAQIKRHIRSELSPRHVPDHLLGIAEVPCTLSGKKLEIPLKKILAGVPPTQAASRDTLANPEALDAVVKLLRGDPAQ